MTAEQVDFHLSNLSTIDIHSPELIGYELVTQDIDITDRFSVSTLLYMLQDCEGAYGRKVPYKVAKAPNGTLTLWTLPPEPPQY